MALRLTIPIRRSSHARDVVIVDSVRTGLAKSFRGTFNLTRPDDMVAHCIDALLDRNSQIDPAEVEDVIVGAASQTGEQGIARLAVILSKMPVTTARKHHFTRLLKRA